MKLNWKEVPSEGGQIKHCLLDMGNGIYCSGEMVHGRFSVFESARYRYTHQDVRRYINLSDDTIQGIEDTIWDDLDQRVDAFMRFMEVMRSTQVDLHLGEALWSLVTNASRDGHHEIDELVTAAVRWVAEESYKE